jgi:hypothetical protein
MLDKTHLGASLISRRKYMHLVEPHKPVFVYADGREAGLMFHVATLSDRIPDSPHGIWISDDYASKSPTLRTVELEGLTLFFKVVDPLLNARGDAPIRSMLYCPRAQIAVLSN